MISDFTHRVLSEGCRCASSSSSFSGLITRGLVPWTKQVFAQEAMPSCFSLIAQRCSAATIAIHNKRKHPNLCIWSHPPFGLSGMHARQLQDVTRGPAVESRWHPWSDSPIELGTEIDAVHLPTNIYKAPARQSRKIGSLGLSSFLKRR